MRAGAMLLLCREYMEEENEEGIIQNNEPHRPVMDEETYELDDDLGESELPY